MAPPRYIPERTVDSLFAAEWIRDNPSAFIWSPTNYAGSPDHILYAPGARGFVIECKAVDVVNGVWRAPINKDQLDQYAKMTADVYYVVVAPSDSFDAPWTRSCGACGGPCRACPRDARTMASLEPWVRTAPSVLRFQPWFAHWTWIITARDLKKHISHTYLDLNALATGAVAAQRLCHFFGQLKRNKIVVPLLTDYGLDNYPAVWASTARDADETTPPILAILNA